MSPLRSRSHLVPVVVALVLTPPVARGQSNPPLREVPIDLDLSEPSKRVDPVVFFEPADPYGEAGPVTGLLRRELYRQAVMLAARDELGLTARDAVLRDVPPDDLPPGNRFRVNPRLAPTAPHEVKIEVGPEAGSRVIWKAKADGPPVVPDDPLGALVTAEWYSRTRFVAALKRAGLRGSANPKDPAAAVPAEAETLLGQMTFTAQFAAARLLHEAVRTKGESPATLGALSRAYAHLGVLTDTQFGGQTWAFKARGLLYAQRLRQRDPAAPIGLWHRAYAAALAGMHRAALADLAAADGVRGTARPPAWVALTEALLQFDSATLKELSAGGPNADLARLFHFLTVEDRGSPHLTLTAGTELLKRTPECYRVQDAVAETGGIASMHSTTLTGLATMARTFPGRVGEMPGLPKAVADAVAAGAPEPDLVKALVAAGKSRDDRGEPSWAVLGRLAQEARTVQVCGRLTFLCRGLSVPADEFFAEVRPLVADHPLFPLLEAITFDPVRQRAEYAKRLRAVKVPELTYRHHALMHGLRALGDDAARSSTRVAGQHGDDLYYDLYLNVRNYLPNQTSLAPGRRMLAQSPHAPLARASVLTFDLELPDEQVAAWAKDAQHPAVFLALARRAMAQYSPNDAEAPALKAIELSPDRVAYQLLASVYDKKGDEEKWLATLERFLKEPDPGLDHAAVRQQIALRLIGRRDFKRAMPYAEAAAETWAGWGMEMAVRCAEGLQDWDRAELWARRMSERYAESAHAWYFWCLRHRRGDLPAAQELFEKHLKQVGEPRTRGDLMVAAVYHAATGEPRKAAGYLVAAHAAEGAGPVVRPPHEGLLLAAAVEYDALGDTVARDRALGQITGSTHYGPVIGLIRDSLRKGEKEAAKPQEIRAAINRLSSQSAQSDCGYFLGRFLQTRGQHDLAAEYLGRSAAEGVPGFALAPPLAGIALRELEKKK